MTIDRTAGVDRGVFRQPMSGLQADGVLYEQEIGFDYGGQALHLLRQAQSAHWC